MINLLGKTCGFIKDNKFANKRWKGVISGKKYFRWFAVSTCPPGQVLASPDMSKVRVLVQFRTFLDYFFRLHRSLLYTNLHIPY